MELGMKKTLTAAERISTSQPWFEVIRLPNEVYAFSEPGHFEEVTSFLILGEAYDLLYDTGMGIASIKLAIADVRAQENLPERELFVFNSHGHADHIGGNYEFDKIYSISEKWRVKRLTQALPEDTMDWASYYGSLLPGAMPPEGYDPAAFRIRPIAKEKIDFIEVDQEIDLGNRHFRMILTQGHTDDSVVLYEPESKILFTGDLVTYPMLFLNDFQALERDLALMAELDVKYHYSTHDDQLVELDLRTRILASLRKVMKGKAKLETVDFMGGPRRVFHVDGMQFWHISEIIMY